MYLLAGIGNKGKKYNNTRHNVGFLIIDQIIKRYNVIQEKNSFDSQINKGIIHKKKVLLVKPMTFVNNSGKAISRLISFYKVPLNKLYVFHDDIDLDLSRVKIKLGGSAAGHNGIKNIDALVGKDYFRNPNNLIETRNYVLQKFSSSEKNRLLKKVDILVENINLLFEKNFNNLMNILVTK